MERKVDTVGRIRERRKRLRAIKDPPPHPHSPTFTFSLLSRIGLLLGVVQYVWKAGGRKECTGEKPEQQERAKKWKQSLLFACMHFRAKKDKAGP